MSLFRGEDGNRVSLSSSILFFVVNSVVNDTKQHPTMPYVGSDGRVTESRSPWRFSILTDFIGAAYDFVALFFRAILDPPQLQGGSVSTHTVIVTTTFCDYR